MSEVLIILVMGHLKGLLTNKQIYELIESQYTRNFKIPSYAQFIKALHDCQTLIDSFLSAIINISASEWTAASSM